MCCYSMYDVAHASREVSMYTINYRAHYRVLAHLSYVIHTELSRTKNQKMMTTCPNIRFLFTLAALRIQVSFIVLRVYYWQV